MRGFWIEGVTPTLCSDSVADALNQLPSTKRAFIVQIREGSEVERYRRLITMYN
jgi:hypothetical protein